MYLLPSPKEIKFTEGRFYLSYMTKIAYKSDNDSDSKGLMFFAKLLCGDILKYAGVEPAIVSGKYDESDIVLSVTSEDKDDEYYELNIGEKIVIEGSMSGIWNGIQTLRQIIKQEGASLSYVEIKDSPDFDDRGVYFDCTRGRIPTLDYLKGLVDHISSYKINQLQLYVEHTFMFPYMSELWRDDTPLTAGDILELDQYCIDRHVELVPSISCFGHLYKLLASKTYRHLNELEDEVDGSFSFNDRMHHYTIDVSNDESMKLIKKIVKDYSQYFSSEKFNICCDETFDLGKGKAKALAEEKGVQRIYVDFVKELCFYVQELGKVPMFWGDIICKSPELLPELPEGTICLNWGYNPDETEENTQKITAAGGLVYNCPGVQGWNEFVNSIHNSYENIIRMVEYGKKYGCIGILNTDWGDCGHINNPDFGKIGRIYGAAFSWNSDIHTEEEINKQISRLEYLDKEETFVSIINHVADNWDYKWWQMVEFVEKNRRAPNEEELSNIDTYIKNLEAAKTTLTEKTAGLEVIMREKAMDYCLAIDGMIIMNKVAKHMASKEENYELASELETWFYHFKKQWRKNSRESELYRLQGVIVMYADFLRGVR